MTHEEYITSECEILKKSIRATISIEGDELVYLKFGSAEPIQLAPKMAMRLADMLTHFAERAEDSYNSKLTQVQFPPSWNRQQAIAQVKAEILGKNFEEMQAECCKAGWILRRTRIDGNRMIGTADYKPHRIDVEVDDGIITKV